MLDVRDRKLYLGPRLRVLRRELGINQTRMAEELGVSPSYLNHLERNQRPLTAQMLLRLANTYDIDVRDFVAGSDGRAAEDLAELFDDPLLRDLGVPRHEVREAAENHPNFAEATLRLHRALVDLRRTPAVLRQIEEQGAGAVSAVAWLRGLADRARNHHAAIDEAAEALAATLPDIPSMLEGAMIERLDTAHRVSVRTLPQDAIGDSLYHYDFHRRRLMLSDRLPPAARRFAVARQLGWAALEAHITAAVEAARPPDGACAVLLRIALTGYAGAALLMPYGAILAATRERRIDLPLIEARFQVSPAQLAERLTTLSRRRAAGVPFFLLTLDPAGNVLRRHAAAAPAFARYVGGCPRWTAHRPAADPAIAAEFVETTDGARWLTLARAVPRTANPGALSRLTLVLGCAAEHAPGIVHADGLDPARATMIGPGCPACDRPRCPDRALPPATRTLEMDPHRREPSLYRFRRT